jgi:hypothetical protein
MKEAGSASQKFFYSSLSEMIISIDTENGVKGDTANAPKKTRNGGKQGATITVPLFIQTDEKSG